MSLFNIFKRKNKSKEDTGIKNTFLSFVQKYTSIPSQTETIDRDLKECRPGIFINELDCSLFLVFQRDYAIRFKDNMNFKECQKVFSFLKNEFGDPDFFAEYCGYIWEKENYCLLFGLVSLNYNYEVPMIRICRNISIFDRKITYKKYHDITDAISSTLKNWGIDLQEYAFFQLTYTNDFGFGTIIRF